MNGMERRHVCGPFWRSLRPREQPHDSPGELLPARLEILRQTPNAMHTLTRYVVPTGPALGGFVPHVQLAASNERVSYFGAYHKGLLRSLSTELWLRITRVYDTYSRCDRSQTLRGPKSSTRQRQLCAMDGPVSLPLETTDHTGIAYGQRDAIGHISRPTEPK